MDHTQFIRGGIQGCLRVIDATTERTPQERLEIVRDTLVSLERCLDPELNPLLARSIKASGGFATGGLVKVDLDRLSEFDVPPLLGAGGQA